MNTKTVLRFSLLAVSLLGLLFLSVQPAFAALGWVGNMWPIGGSTNTITLGGNFTVYVQVYKSAVTEPAGQGANITCTLYWAPVPYFGGTWGTATSTSMTYNGDIGNNDEYRATITPAVGLYEFTAYCTDTTDSTSYWQGAGNGKLVVDAASGTCNGASQGNNEVYYNGLLHDSFSTSYRSPIGAVTPSTTITLRFRTCMDDVNAAPTIRLWNDRTDAETITSLTFDGHSSDATLGGVTTWKYDLAVGADPTIYYYVFKATDGTATVYYRDDNPTFYGGGYGTTETDQGTAYNNSNQLTVYDSSFSVPEWIQRGVIYQIFPDRFRDGASGNDPAAGRFFYNESGGTIVRSNTSVWNTTLCDPRDAGGVCPGDYSNNFYGGDLAGITEKINAGYFDQLGVSVLYLNPIFRSPSNHKYDTANFLEIDPDFGALSDFQALVAAANAHNIKIILDGVFNHTSSDSMYFDRYGRFDASGNLTDPDGGTDDNSGACEAGASSFYSWFYFPHFGNAGKDQPGDVIVYCPNGAGDANQTYEAWYGYSSLPKLQANLAAVRNLIWNNGLSSVGPYWTDQGASGWRFDVGADVDPGLTSDPSNDYWEGFRSAVRAIDSSTITLGEEWGDASPWLLGDEWDSVMNYRYRSAVLSWLFTGCSGNGCTGGTVFEDNDSNSASSSGAISYISPSQFNARLRSIQEDYPPMAWKAMMNLEGSHDTNRLRFLLKKANNDNDSAAVQRMKEMWLFAFTYAGAPTLYYGDEMGLNQDGVWDGSRWQDDPYNRAPFPWDDTSGDFTADTTLQDFARKMSSIRNSYRALQDGDVQHGIVIDDANKVYGFARTNDTQAAIILLNRDSSSHSVTVSGLNAAPYNLPNGTVLLDVIEGGSYTVTGGAVTVSVNATWGAVLLEGAEIETPAAPASSSTQRSGSDVIVCWDLVSTDTASGREVPTSYTVHRSATTPFTPGAGNLIATVNPPAYGVADSRLSYTDVGAGGADYYAVCAVNAGGKSSCTASLATQCSADAYMYRSAATGSWADNTSWEVSTNGGVDWSAAGCWPTSANDAIQVRNGHALTVASDLTVDQTTIATGGQVTVNSGATLTIENGADATDLTVSAGANLTVNGTILNNAASISSTSATAIFNNGGIYQHNFTTTGGTIPTATWNSGSTVEVIGYTTYGGTPGGYVQSFSNLTWNCPSQSGLVNFGGNLTTINGNFTVTSTGTSSLRLTSNSALTLNIGGNLTISGGLLNSSNGTANPVVNVGGSVILNGGTLDAGASGVATYNVAGNWTNNGGTFTPRTGTVNFNGTSVQTIGGTASSTFTNLTINNASGVTLGANVTVNGVLTFTDGKITTGANTLILGSSATISGAGAGKYVYGNLEKPFGTGALDPYTFPVGGSASYTPIILNFGSVTTGGSVTASVSDAVCTGFANSGIDQSNYIRRCWTLTNSGMAFDSYDATFTYDPAADFQGAVDESNLAVQKSSDNGATWTNPVGDYDYPDSNQVKGTGFTSFSIFAIGGGTSSTPVTLSYFKAEGSGGLVNFTWTTAAESGNLGFNLYALEDGKLRRLNAELIPSQKVDSLERLDYFYQAETSGTVFYLEEVNIQGQGDRHGPFALGEAYGGQVEENQINWTAIQNENGQAQVERQNSMTPDMNIPAEAMSAEEESRETPPADPVLTPEVGTPEESQPGEATDQESDALEVSPARPVDAKNLNLLMTTTLNLKVRQTGLYRVTYEMLKAAGLDLKGVQLSKVTLTNQGKAVPIYVKGLGRFGPGAYIEFYGQALDTIYTDTNVYTLQITQSLSPRIPVNNSPPSRAIKPMTSYTETRVVNNQKAYSNYSPGVDAWYEKEMLVFTASKSWDFTFQVDGLNPFAPASMEVVIWGVTDWPQGNDHHVLVSVNGVALSEQTFDGLVEKRLKLDLPAGLLKEGTNTLQITLPGDAGVEAELVALDQYTVTYQRAFQAKDGRLTFTAAGKFFKVTNLPTKNVVVYRQDSRGIVKLGQVQVQASGGTFNATFAGTGQSATYFVSAVESLNSPTFEAVKQSVDLNRPAQYLIIAHPNFIAGIQPLVQARQAQGLTVSVVDVADLYTQYSYGIFDPSAIQKFIAYATQNLGTEYVLLVGGDTYDYRNYLGINSLSFVPSLYAKTGPIANFVPSDPLFADVNRDNAPDVAIGRFPVRTVAELDMLVNKTLAYASKNYGKTAVFASDLNDGSASYKNISNELAQTLPGDWTVENIHLDDLSVSAARTQLLAAMNRGTALVTFTGHSEPRTWTFVGLFKLRDAVSLTNAGRPFVVVQWGCWNTYYVDPVNNYLVQGFLVSGDRGAAAVLGATTLADSHSENLLGRLLTPRLTQPGMRIGDALQVSKAELAQTHPDLLDVLLGWSLMGDPVLVIQP